MQILYVDDSGSMKNPDENNFILGGVSVFERQIYWISKELDNIAGRINPSNPAAVELHASAILSGKEPPWNSIKNKNDRIKIIKEVLKVLDNVQGDVSAFGCAIHKPSFPGHDSTIIAFEEMCSRFEAQLQRFYINNNNQRGFIVFDNCTHQEILENMMLQYRDEGTQWREIKNIPEVPLFIDSRLSRLTQLADHIAWSIFRYYEREDAEYFNIIGKYFDKDGGKIHGLVHRTSQHRTCLCPACLTRR